MDLLLATTQDPTAAQTAGAVVGSLLGAVIGYVISVLAVAGIFRKAGVEGWKGWVPIYNQIVLVQVAGKPWWWFLLLLIPVVNVVVAILVLHALSVSFGHGAGFTVGLVLLSLIFFYVLWLGSSTYRGPGGTGGPAVTF